MCSEGSKWESVKYRFCDMTVALWDVPAVNCWRWQGFVNGYSFAPYLFCSYTFHPFSSFCVSFHYLPIWFCVKFIYPLKSDKSDKCRLSSFSQFHLERVIYRLNSYACCFLTIMSGSTAWLQKVQDTIISNYILKKKKTQRVSCHISNIVCLLAYKV